MEDQLKKEILQAMCTDNASELHQSDRLGLQALTTSWIFSMLPSLNRSSSSMVLNSRSVW